MKRLKAKRVVLKKTKNGYAILKKGLFKDKPLVAGELGTYNVAINYIRDNFLKEGESIKDVRGIDECSC